MSINKLLDKSFLLKLTMRQVGIFNCIPVKLNGNDVIVFNSVESRKLTVLCGLHFLATCSQIFQCTILSKLTTKNISTVENILAWFILQLTVLSTYCVLICRTKGPTWKLYLDNILNLNKKLKNITASNSISTKVKWKSLKLLQSLNLLLVPTILLTILLFAPLYVVGFHWQNPCKLSLMFYFVLNECSDNQIFPQSSFETIFQALLKSFLFLGNIWVLAFGLHGFYFVCLTGFVISPMTILEYIQQFRTQSQAFMQNIYKQALVYRQFQVLNKMSNFLQQTCLQLFMTSAMIAVSMNLGLLVASFNGSLEEANVFLMGSFLMVTVNGTICILVVFGGMAAVYAESKHLIADEKRLELTFKSRMNKRWCRMYWRSCSTIQFKFGNSNFLEEHTPLKCFDCVLNLTVQTLILSRNR